MRKTLGIAAALYALVGTFALAQNATLGVGDGGTGGNNPASARAGISAAKSGVNSDITSITGLTTPLPVSEGGTGGTSTNGLANAGANTNITSLSGLTTPLSVPQGGTGATTLSGLRATIGAAGSGANSDITSLSALSTPLSVLQGGTGTNTLVGLRAAIAAAASGANSDIVSLSGLTTPLAITEGGTGTGSLSGLATALSLGPLATASTVNLTTQASGILQAAQHPALTGDVTTSAGSVATTISAGVVTSAKMAAGAALANLGYTPLVPANNLSDVGNVVTARTNLGLGPLSTASSVNLNTQATGTLQAAQAPALGGDIVSSSGSLTTTISGGVVTSAKMAPGAAVGNLGFTPLVPSNNLSDLASASAARSNLGLGPLATATSISLTSQATGTLQAGQAPAFTGDVTSAGGTLATSISNGVVTAAKMAAGAAVGNLGFTPLAPANNLSELTSAPTARTNLGLGPLATASTVNLSSQATGTLQAAQAPAMTGDVTSPAGSLATTIGAGAVTGSKMASGAAVANLGFTPLAPANNLSEVASPTTARANLGLQYNVANQIWPSNADAHLDPRVLTPTTAGFDPKKHLAQFSKAVSQGRSPVVCTTGDSLYAIYDPVSNNGGVDAIAPSETPLQELTDQITDQNPGSHPNFVNRAVGGQTWYYLQSAPLNTAPFPSWYVFNGVTTGGVTQPLMPWLSYVRGADCDTVFINLGGNDRTVMFAGYVYAALNTIAGWGTAPQTWAASTSYNPGTQVIDTNGDLEVTIAGGTSGTSAPSFSTAFNGITTPDGTASWVNVSGGVYTPRTPDITLITNGGATTASAPYNTSAYQIGYLTAAAFTRGLGENGGGFLGIPNLPPIGLIDKGRYFDGEFYGFDPANEYLALVPSQTGLVVPGSSFSIQGTSPLQYSQYSFPTTNGGDEYIDVTFPGQAVAMQGNTLNFNLGGYTFASTAQLKIFRSLAGGVRVQYSVDSVAASVGAGTDITTTVPWGTGDIHIQIDAKQSVINIFWNNTLITPTPNAAQTMVVPRWIGSYQPTLSIFPFGTLFSGTMTINHYAAGTYMPTIPLYSAQWMYDTLGILGEGGDGVAHPTSASIAAIDQAVIRSINFHATTLGQTAGTATNDNAAPGNVGEFISSRCGNNGVGNAATITIGSPAAISWSGANISGINGRDDICPFELTTTGALPTGLAVSTLYWTVPQNGVINIASSLANALAGTVITTSGTQSGTQNVVMGYPLTTATATEVTALTLTPGDWDVAGNGFAEVATASPFTVTTSEIVAIQTGSQCASTPPVMPASPGISGGNASWYPPGGFTSSAFFPEMQLIGVGPSRISLAATTTVCLLEKDLFTTGPASGLGYIGARRAR